MPDIKIFCAGGTIDKVYYDALSDYQIGDPQVEWILAQSGVNFTYEIESVIKKDSLEMDDQDRALMAEKVSSDPCDKVLITHGTDTMVDTAQVLQKAAIKQKTIIFVGAMQPARFKDSDAMFNVGFAIAALQTLAAGVYIAMSGHVFPADEVRKNRDAGRFENKP